MATVLGPALGFDEASLGYGSRRLWAGLTAEVAGGEFLAVLGANGSGKTSLLNVLLGLRPLTSGTATIDGRPVTKGSGRIGYVPQQRRVDPLTPLCARDMVRQGLDGHRWGIGLPGSSRRRRRLVAEVLESVGAGEFADRPVGLLSGGEQQRVRIAQALVDDPRLLLCDEPLLSLDLASQRTIAALVDDYRRTREATVVFVTHEIDPILSYVDRVLYLVDGRFRIGTVDEVLASATSSDLYDTPVEVRSGGQVAVAGIPEATTHPHLADHEFSAR
jgi:zinc/manganese transport system ATP-binding protein